MTGSPPEVTKRLYAAIALLCAVLCVFGGYLLGRNRGCDARNNDTIPYNLTTYADALYKKSIRLQLKPVYPSKAETIREDLLMLFCCQKCGCGIVRKKNLSDLVKHLVNNGVNKLIWTINNATAYLDTYK